MFVRWRMVRALRNMFHWPCKGIHYYYRAGHTACCPQQRGSLFYSCRSFVSSRAPISSVSATRIKSASLVLTVQFICLICLICLNSSVHTNPPPCSSAIGTHGTIAWANSTPSADNPKIVYKKGNSELSFHSVS